MKKSIQGIEKRSASTLHRVRRRKLDAQELAQVRGGSIDVPVKPPVTPWPL